MASLPRGCDNYTGVITGRSGSPLDLDAPSSRRMRRSAPYGELRHLEIGTGSGLHTSEAYFAQFRVRSA